jgi:hypothetical protein
MQSQLDEKEFVIIQILSRLRQFNPVIGYYDKSIMTDDLEYAVKLTNGRIVLSKEIVHAFEQCPACIKDEELKMAGTRFFPSKRSAPVTPVIRCSSTSFVQQPQLKPSPLKIDVSPLARLLIYAAIIVFVLVGFNFYVEMQRQGPVYMAEDNKARIRNDIASYVKAEGNENAYSKQGGAGDVKISVTNSTDYMIDNVKVKIIYTKANGDVSNERTIDFNSIDPQSKNTMPVPGTQQGTSIQYEIVSIRSKALGLY